MAAVAILDSGLYIVTTIDIVIFHRSMAFDISNILVFFHTSHRNCWRYIFRHDLGNKWGQRSNNEEIMSKKYSTFASRWLRFCHIIALSICARHKIHISLLVITAVQSLPIPNMASVVSLLVKGSTNDSNRWSGGYNCDILVIY